MGESIARCWEELSGQRNWEGLLQPLDHDLRRYIIHYGQMTGAVGDLFNSGNASVGEFFAQACLVKGNPYEYKVTRFIYAGSESVETAWIGYVAVASDQGKRVLGRRDILIAWRGTVTPSEWRNNLRVAPRATASDIFPDMTRVKVHRGFHSLYTGPTRPDSPHNGTSAREQVRVEVEKLVKTYKDEKISITVTGFSLGAALATLTAMDIVANRYNKYPNRDELFMVTAFTFGGPRVGNNDLAGLFDVLGRQNLRLLRIKNMKDWVPSNPPNQFSYTNVGKELIVDTSKSTYLKQMPLARNSLSGSEAEYQTLRWVYVGLLVLMYLYELWRPLLGAILIIIWDGINRGMGGDKYQTLCWVCYEAAMCMLYYKLFSLPLGVLIGIFYWAENNRRDGEEYQTRRWVHYGMSLFMVLTRYRILLLYPIIKIFRLERRIGGDRDVGNDDIGEDQYGCELITISEDGVGDGVVHSLVGSMFRGLYTCHNMDVYMHGVAIKDIHVDTPVHQLAHDIALVNKHSSRVRNDYGYPTYWWAGVNRRQMVQRDDDGRWIKRRDVSILLSIAYLFDLEDSLL